MKAAANGAINLSILDGWWDEAYVPEAGWAIGRREDDYPDQNAQDAGDSNHIYKLLEEEIVPMFYDVGQDSVPNRWVSKMKDSMAAICPFFNTNRMVRDYLEKMYIPGMKRTQNLSQNKFEKARRLAAWKAHLKDGWSGIEVERIGAEPLGTVPVGATIKVSTSVRLGTLKPSDVAVQIYEGRVDANGEIVDAEVVEMERDGSKPDGSNNYTGAFRTAEAGQYGLTIRVLPKNEDLSGPLEPGLIFWAR
jgi:starch phosphorylase